MLDVKFLTLIVIGFFWGGLTAPVSIKLAEIYGIMDIPDARKIHTVNTPRGGGLGLWAGYMLMVLFMSYEIYELKFLNVFINDSFTGFINEFCSFFGFSFQGYSDIIFCSGRSDQSPAAIFKC